MAVPGEYAAFWPRSPREAKIQPFAKRFESLEGKTIAQLWDFLFRGDEVFDLLEEGLKKKIPGVRFVSWREFGNTHGSDEREIIAALPGRLKALGVDGVISGMAC